VPSGTPTAIPSVPPTLSPTVISSISLAALGKQGIFIFGSTTLFGKIANYIGDVNGDGIDDIVVYSTSFKIPKYVIFGKLNNQMDDISIASFTANSGFELQYSDVSPILSCHALGDINGDGYDDFIISDVKYNSNRGAVYVINGRSSFPSKLYISTLTSNERLVISGSNMNDYFGKYLISKSGSVSGCFDILTCSYSRCYVITCIQFYERAINVDDLLKLDSKYGYIIQGSVICSMKYTMLLSSIGDVNGDGLSDFAISSSSYFIGRGVVYVMFGTHVNKNINVDLDAMDISVGIVITHSGSGAGIGSSVSAAGDINGDGVNDIVIGSTTVEAFVIYGGSNITNMDLKSFDMSQGFSISSALSQSIVDFRVVGNIDVNHDGISDIAIGCPYDSVAERVYVIYGTNHRYRSNVILEYMTSAQGLVIVTSDLRDKSGYYISCAGDYNNDKYRDLLVSAPYAFNQVGAVYVITNALASNTRSPTLAPNNLPKPTKRPSNIPSVKPSRLPSARPSKSPTSVPSKRVIVRQPTTPKHINGTATNEPSTDPSGSYTSEPSGSNLLNMTFLSISPTLRPSCIPSNTPVIKSIRPTKYPSHYPSLSPTTHSLNTNESLSPVSYQLSYSPSCDPTYMLSFSSNKTSNSSLLDASESKRDNIYIKISFVSIIVGPMIIFTILVLFYIYFRYVYKFVMEKIGYDFKKPMTLDTTVNLRVASLDALMHSTFLGI
jgi:hypothetical protein